MNSIYFLFLLLLNSTFGQTNPSEKKVSIVILGTIQDAGAPQIGCEKDCCKDLFAHPDNKRQVVSLGLIDSENKKTYLFEATPDLPKQMKALKRISKSEKELSDGIFLSHAHIGHYTGLMYLGKEAIDSKKVQVFAMPKMKSFLETNGPWSQLVKRENIQIQQMETEKAVSLSSSIQVTPFEVPHRDEYSETVGYKISGPNKSALFIPDIDKWEKWDNQIIEEIKKVDYAFLDATFFSGKELNNRDMAQIPHPFILESMKKFEGMSKSEKKKVIFIHFNHTNPVIDENSEESKLVLKNGFQIARIHDVYDL